MLWHKSKSQILPNKGLPVLRRREEQAQQLVCELGSYFHPLHGGFQMPVLYFLVNGGGTIVKYNWSNAAARGGGAAPFSFSYWWVYFFTSKGRMKRGFLTFGQAELQDLQMNERQSRTLTRQHCFLSKKVKAAVKAVWSLPSSLLLSAC